MFKTRKEADTLVGGLSSPSKMPCYSYSIPANRCITGAVMAKNPNTICSGCYATKGRYVFPNVQNALERRFASLNHPRWIEAMAFLIGRDTHFRWHDSGDLQSVEHLERIVEVCKRTPNTLHWLPTREYLMVRAYVEKHGAFPENLVVRLSATKFNGIAPVGMAKQLGVYVSGATTVDYDCPASHQENKCGDCRACWDKTKFQVNYKKH